MEGMINTRLVWSLESQGLLSEKQWDFRKNCSTLDHLVCFETFIRNAFVKKEHVLIIFFDLEKASDSAIGLDQVHYQCLNTPPKFCSVLLKVYNHVWESGCFPPSWHEAVVIPIPKPGKDHLDPSNFRPIALTSCVKQWRGWSTLTSCGPSSRRVFFPRSSEASGRTAVRWIILFVLKHLLEMPSLKKNTS